MSKLRDMKKRFLPLSMLLITIVLAQASFVANATDIPGKYTPRNAEPEATFSSFMKSIRANQETGLIDPALLIEARKTRQTTTKSDYDWDYAGPDNFGGMTRAIVYNNDGTVIIGTMGGCIFKTDNGGITFGRINNLNLPISCMVKGSDGAIYIGTGDGRDAEDLNGLSDMGDATSFAGNGIYKLVGNTVTQLPATLPNGSNGWDFVNDLTIANGKIYAATAGGLMVCDEANVATSSWTQALTGVFRSVKSNNRGDVLAADAKDVYYKRINEEVFTPLPLASNNNPKIIAMSPDDPNYWYIAFMKGEAGAYTTGDIYFTNNATTTTEITLEKAVAVTSLYPILGSDANYDGFMTVVPNNPRKVFIGSDNLWVLEDRNNLGVNSYRPEQISKYKASDNSIYAMVANNRYSYLHQGIQNIVFEPTSEFDETNYKFFVGTTGGIYKGEFYDNLYSYKGGNRYYIFDGINNDKHTSVARIMSVGIGGTNKVLGASLDHGTLNIYRDPLINNETTGIAIFPNTNEQSNAYQQLIGYFTKDYAGGPCAISSIDPNILFVSGTSNLTTPIHRSQTDGEDYDLTNFYGADDPVITNSALFKTPYAIYEKFNEAHTVTEIYSNKMVLDSIGFYDSLVETIYIDTLLHVTDTFQVADSLVVFDTILHVQDTFEVHETITIYDTNYVQETKYIRRDTLYMPVRDTMFPGERGIYHSRIADYPLFGIAPAVPDTLQNPQHQVGDLYAWMPGDTIRNMQDSISTMYVCGIVKKVSNKYYYRVYFTRDAHVFNKKTSWILLGELNGVPVGTTINADGAPSVVSISPDGDMVLIGTLGGRLYKFDKLNQIFYKEQLDTTDSLNYIYNGQTDFLLNQFGSRAITSIAFDPNDKNIVIVTLGNFGNSDFIYRSTDGGATFNAIQGEGLPLVPIYSCIIEKSTHDIIVGTECGIYTSSDNGLNWRASGTITSPVMDLKQAVQPNRPEREEVLYDEMGIPTITKYAGISNEGMIAAATYGSGVLVCTPAAYLTMPAEEEEEQ